MAKLLFVVLFVAMSLVATEWSFFEEYQNFETSAAEIVKEIELMLDNTQENKLNGSIDAVLALLQNGMCFDTATFRSDCASDMMFGCNCMNAFSKLGGVKCPQIPCRIINYIRENLADILLSLKDAFANKDIGSIMNTIVDHVYTSFLNLTCPCRPGLTGAVFECIENYDALITKTDMGSYITDRIANANLEPFKKIMDITMTIHCLQVGDEQCYEDFGQMMKKWAEMIDNTFDNDNDCESWMRLETLIAKFVDTYTKEPSKTNKIAKAAKDVLKEGFCKRSCRKYMADNFYSCCAEEAFKTLEELDFEEQHKNLINTIAAMMGEAGDMIRGQGAMSRVSSTFNPRIECKGNEKKHFIKKLETCPAA